MFRSSIIIRELVQSLAKVIFMLKHSVFKQKYNFSQVHRKLRDDGRRPKHVGAIFMFILM